MIYDLAPVSRWYVLSQGFKVYENCSECRSEAISYHKARVPGHRGILARCQNCSKQFPVRFKAKEIGPKKVSVS